MLKRAFVFFLHDYYHILIMKLQHREWYIPEEHGFLAELMRAVSYFQNICYPETYTKPVKKNVIHNETKLACLMFLPY